MGAIVTAVMSRFFSDRFIADCPPSLETIRATFLSIAPEGYAACCAAISAVDLLDRLASLRQPALVINGSRDAATPPARSEEHTSELQSLMRSSYAVFCLKKTTIQQ